MIEIEQTETRGVGNVRDGCERAAEFHGDEIVYRADFCRARGRKSVYFIVKERRQPVADAMRRPVVRVRACA